MPHAPRPLVRAAASLALAALLTAPASAQRAAPVVSPALTGGPAFAENRGQWPEDVRYRARLGGADVWVTADAVVLDFYEAERVEEYAGAPRHDEPAAARRRGHVVAMRFEEGRARRATGRGLQAAYHNYFLGTDPARWASRVPLFDEVVLHELYDGVDLRLYAEGGRLRYDLGVAPGADVGQVRMRLEGATSVGLAGGVLSVGTALGAVEHRGLAAYQEGAGGRRDVASAFVVGADGVVGFTVEGGDPSRPLVVDPLIWATFLGGTSEDRARGVAVGADGSAYVVGHTQSTDFPTTPGAYDTSAPTPFTFDAFVTRLAADGASLVYSTFLGGMSDDYGQSVAVRPDGSAVVAGETRSTGFPTTPGAFDTSFNGVSSTGGDAFVTRLSPDGSALVYSTFLGGTEGEGASAVSVGADGSATVAGDTGGADFPTTPGAFDTSYNGGSVYTGDAFVARLSPDGSALVYSTLLGGAGEDWSRGVAVHPDGGVTVAGTTRSAGFPATPGAFDTSYNGSVHDYDAFVTRLSPDGSSLLYSTFLGGPSYDLGQGVGVDADGSATVAGSTKSAGFPTTPGAFDNSFNGNAGFGFEGDAFVARLSPDGSALVYSTFLGGANNEGASAVSVGADGSATVAGTTGSAGFPTTPSAFDNSFNDATPFEGDAFVARLSASGAALVYSTFLGGTSVDEARALAVSADGMATVVGDTRGAGFPATPGAFDTFFNNGWVTAFVARFDVEPPAFVISAVARNSPVALGETLRIAVVATNHASDAISGDLVLDVVRQGGIAAVRTLLRGVTLLPGETDSVVVGLKVPWPSPLGLYTATATALEGGTTNIGEAALVFRVVAPTTGVASGAAQEGAPWEATVLNDGFGGAAEARSPSALTVEAMGAVVRPNPATDRAAFAFTLADAAEVRLALYDVLGREVATLEAGLLEAGAQRLGLDLSALPAGAYVWRLSAGGRMEAGRLTLVR